MSIILVEPGFKCHKKPSTNAPQKCRLLFILSKSITVLLRYLIYSSQFNLDSIVNWLNLKLFIYVQVCMRTNRIMTGISRTNTRKIKNYREMQNKSFTYGSVTICTYMQLHAKRIVYLESIDMVQIM